MNKIIEYKDKTDKDCPKCSFKLYSEIVKEIDYPYVCLECDENFYNIEIKQPMTSL
jgi:DNA-directed RNA polymerase subunit RPC12/RpoP